MKENDFLILSNLFGFQHTINEIIAKIRRADFDDGLYRVDIHFYTHLNKKFAPLMRKGFVEVVGQKPGKTRGFEKVWALTPLAEAAILSRLPKNKEYQLSA